MALPPDGSEALPGWETRQVTDDFMALLPSMSANPVALPILEPFY